MTEWIKEHPVVWNGGIGPAASFVPTLTRLLFKQTKNVYAYDHVITARLSPMAAIEGRIGCYRRVALDVLMATARKESYYGYGMVSDILVLKAFGVNHHRDYRWDYYWDPVQRLLFGALLPDSNIRSRIPGMIREMLQGKRRLLLVENLHVPVPMDVLFLSTQFIRPSVLFQPNGWVISTASKDVCNQSREHELSYGSPGAILGLLEYYHTLHFDDPRAQHWVVLIKEALQDAAGTIRITLVHQQREDKFWLHVAQKCLYYGILYCPMQGAAARHDITSDELVRCWVAEDLLTPQRTTDRNYRSALEAGKVVIQALQEYSLLPNSPSNTCSRDTGVSVLAMGVPRLKEEELFYHENIDRLTWVSFMNDDGRHVSWDWRMPWHPEWGFPGERLSTLILRGCSNISGFPFDRVLDLHVLDLSYTPINSLPPYLSQLSNLRLFSLRGCSKLETLSSPQHTTRPLSCLGSLETLDMNGVPLLELTQQDCSNKSNLHFLDLSGSRITILPSEFFSEMSSLEELMLGNCIHLKELPPSLAQLSNLLILHLEGTQIISFPEDTFEAMQRLHTLKLIDNMTLMSLPTSLSKANGLRELHINNCRRLRLQFIWELVPGLEDLYIQTWEALEDIKIHGHPNLRTFSVSGLWIRCLSLRGCSKLKIVNISDDLTALEDVDLSGTAIEEVPHSLPNLPQLRMLLLLNVPCFKRFPWHRLVRFPKVFCLDNCSDDGNHLSRMFRQKETDNNIAQIHINDSRIFHSFNEDAANKLVKEGQFFQSFNIQIKPCSVRGKEPRDKSCTGIQRQLPYLDVSCSKAATIVPMMKLEPKRRHVEISAMNQHPNGLRILSVTNSLFITDDASIRCVSDLNCNLMSLEVCQLQHCHKMSVVFGLESNRTDPMVYDKAEADGPSIVLSVFPALKILQASNLNNLVCFLETSALAYLEHRGRSWTLKLKLLTRIHLEHCSRLEKIFPSRLSLPALETLVILFCPSLKTIFYKTYEDEEVAPCPLPNIESIYLQELPQLQHIHEDAMFRFATPKWETLLVRSCRSLRRLPFLKEHPKSKVKVNGERDWWDRLQLSLPEQGNYYQQVPPPPEFASRKKKLIIKSYLR
uniref:Disease resistance protein At4g27190-like leucine-rich repeats domain-containing protein n=1 Tax=Setaria italica TaxID=4555 RepID=K3YL46_SETIT